MDLSQKILIDIGSTSIKWATIDHKDQKTDEGSFRFPHEINPGENIYEVEPDKITVLLKEIIDTSELVGKIFISTQMHGYLLADDHHELLTPYISWRDKRSKNVITPFFVDKKCGVGFKDNLPRASVMAMQKLQPDLMNKVSTFYTLGSFVSYLLTSRNISHITDAVSSGYYTVYGEKAVKTDFALPEVTLDVSKIGEYNGIDVFSPVGDQQASVYGIDSNYDGYILNMGTAAQICAITDEFVEGDFETRPYFDGQFLCTVTGLIGGKDIDLNDPKMVDRMVLQYRSAIGKLPKRDKIVAVGGVVVNHKELIESVLKELEIEYYLDNESNAINGLMKLSKRAK